MSFFGLFRTHLCRERTLKALSAHCERVRTLSSDQKTEKKGTKTFFYDWDKASNDQKKTKKRHLKKTAREAPTPGNALSCARKNSEEHGRAGAHAYQPTASAQVRAEMNHPHQRRYAHAHESPTSAQVRTNMSHPHQRECAGKREKGRNSGLFRKLHAREQGITASNFGTWLERSPTACICKRNRPIPTHAAQ